MENSLTAGEPPSRFLFENRQVAFGIEGSGPPLVLVHGTPWSSFNLRHLAAGLAPRFRVHYFDLLGYGHSDKREGDVSLGIQNRLLGALLDHWQLEKPFIVGHDFGGTTVLRSHLLDGRAYEKLVVIDPVALSPWGSPFFKHIEQHEAAFAGVPDFIHRAIVEAYVKTAAFQALSDEVLDGILSPWVGQEGQQAFYRQIAQADSRFTDEIAEKFSEQRAPALILWGEEDTWIPVEQAYTLQRKMKNAELVTIARAGHLVIEEKPSILLENIERFFLGQPA